jgi:NDP-sugar pyrophosphorylase family protein
MRNPDAVKRSIAGMILAAGHGERMYPLTATLPKALLPVLGIPVLEIIVGKLKRSGAAEIHCNLFHLPDPIESRAAEAGLVIRFHREPELLGTGGGIGAMASAVSGFGATLLCNCDVLSDIDLAAALSFHEARGALVTLVLAPAGPPANVFLGAEDAVLAIGPGAAVSGSPARRLGYTGAAVLSPGALAFFPRDRRAGLVEILTDMIEARPGSVLGYDAARAGTPAWGETGSPAGYLEIHRRILVDKIKFDPLLDPPPLPLHAGVEAVIDPGASWRGFLEIGPRAAIRRGAALENCVVLEGATVLEDSRHANEIIFAGGTMKAEAMAG